jgi:hypothetical protein
MQAFQLGVNRLITVCTCLKDEAAPENWACRVKEYRLLLVGGFFFLKVFLNLSLDIISGLSLNL